MHAYSLARRAESRRRAARACYAPVARLSIAEEATVNVPSRDRHTYFYVSPGYRELPDTPSSPAKVLRLYLSQAPLPYLSMVYVGALFAGASLAAVGSDRLSTTPIASLAVTTLTGLCALWALNLLDEVVDVEADRLVHPERPVASRAVTVRHTMVVMLALLAGVLVMNFAHGLRTGAFVVVLALFDLGVLLLSGRLRLPAANELLTPLLWGTMPVYVFWVLNPDALALGLWLGAFSYLADLAQDVPGGIHDVEGDARQGVQTVATALGGRGAAVVALLAFGASLVPLAAFFATRGLPGWAWALEAAVAVWAAAPFVRLVRAQTAEHCAVARAMGFHFANVTYIVLGLAVVAGAL